MWGVIIGGVLGAILGPRLGLGWFMGAIVGAVLLWAMTHQTGTPGGGIGGVFTAIGDWFRRIFGFVGTMVTAIAVFLGLFTVMVYFTGISPFKVIETFRDMGWPSEWSADIRRPVLLFVCGVLLIAGISMPAIRTNRKAVTILVISFLVSFGMLWLPEPTASIVPVGDAAWKETSKRMAEEGIPVVAVKAIGRGVLGTKERKGVLVTKWNQTRTFLFGDPAPKPARSVASATTVVYTPVSVPAPAGPTSVLYPFEADGCYKRNLGYKAQWSPNKGSMRVYDPSGGSHVETLGGKPAATSTFGPGLWGFCAEGPDAATGVVIWE